jgi:flagellar hook protein FlgE
MIRGMYSAISGLRNHQVMLDVVSNNLANVNTVGYKASRTTFKDQLQQTLYGGSAGGANTGGTNAAQVGLGVQLGSIDGVMTGGSFQPTGNPLDVAIQGDGWFQVTMGAATDPTQYNYTRAGNFRVDDQGRLVTAEGYFVVGRNAATNATEYITVDPQATGVAIGSDGAVSYVPAGGGPRQVDHYLELAKFPNENGLLRLSGNRWGAHPAAGTPATARPGSNNGAFGFTIGGTLEMSNVDLAGEFTNMIVAQRGFQANSRVISTSDEMLQDLVNLKR